MLVYLVLAFLASTLMALGLLMMKSRATALPDARGLSIISGVLTWLRDPIWASGLGVQTIGWAMYVIAVSRAPISIVAVMMQGGIALFVVASVVFLGERARSSEWAGIIAIAAGMILLSWSLSAGTAQGATDDRAVIVLSVLLVLLAAAPFAQRQFAQGGTAQAIASGIAFGLAGLYTKAMTDSVAAGGGEIVLRIVSNPWIYAMMTANISGMIMLQNSFHQARGIITMPLSSALSNLVPIAGGMLAFGEHLPKEPAAEAMRVAAFLLTVIASTMLAGAREEKPAGASVPLKSANLAS
jgi:uncharacterized membrane protein